MTTPIAKMTACLQSVRQDSVNHCVKESSLPLRLALCVGAKVLLLSNFVVEYKIMNGSIGTVTDIVYKDKAGPRDSKSLPAYVIVYFPKSCIPDKYKLFPDKDGRYVSIPAVTERCEKQCCSITMIPLRVCQSITIHKSQGMTIGENEIFTKVVLYLPDSESGGRRTPGSELVGMSRAKDLSCLAIGNESKNLSLQDIQTIGATNAYNLRRKFESKLKKKATATQTKVIKAIKNLDNSEKKKLMKEDVIFF